MTEHMEERMREIAREAVRDSQRETREIVSEAVRQTFIQLGLQHDEPLEMQKDFQHLREWRQATDQFKRKGLLTLAGILVTGVCAAFWVGLRHLLGLGQ